MSTPDRSIDSRLLSAAKAAFLSKGYEAASLSEICGAAGVTTGALYKRYEGKEALFSALVEDTIRDMEALMARVETSDLGAYTDETLYEVFSMRPEDNLVWLKFLYERREGFTLLIKCSAGTRYANFNHEWAERLNGLDYKFYLEACRRGMTAKTLSMAEMQVFNAAVWSLIYEPFLQDFSWEQLERHATLIYQFTDWHGLLGIARPD